jgi:2-polyprenyl-3-methyl-5-hydroxy-6-metoxy-1,4-benzoquinol methylase
MTKKEHWEKVYASKNFTEVSWFQEVPITSIEFLQNAKIAKTAKIIDIGGGESNFVNHLLSAGYEDITVLDISETAIAKKKAELGEAAQKVKWIVSDVVDFQPTECYDFWHDRATFHFLTVEEDIEKYLTTIKNNVNPNGTLVVGTFSEQGPTKCSGLEIKQYSETSLSAKITRFFEKIRCITTEHATPFGTLQDFLFCSFRNLEMAS